MDNCLATSILLFVPDFRSNIGTQENFETNATELLGDDNLMVLADLIIIILLRAKMVICLICSNSFKNNLAFPLNFSRVAHYCGEMMCES